MSDESSNDDEYDAFEDPGDNQERKYPLHDCVDFEGVEALRQLLYMEVEDGDENDDEDEENDHEDGNEHRSDNDNDGRKADDSSSSSDENDSTAAAHAAAIGHSPQLIVRSAPAPSASKVTIANTTEHEKNQIKASDTSDTPEVAEIAAGNSDSVKAAPDQASVVNTESNPDVETPGSLETDHKNNEIIGEPSPMHVDHEAPSSKETKESRSNKESNGANSSPRVKVKLELDPDISINERDEDENTALHVAIIARKLEHVKILLEAGASVRLRCDGSWPIHTAISMGAIAAHRQYAYECMVTLHEHGADLTAKDDSVHTPLYLACMFNLPQIASYILSDDDGLSTLNTRADRAGNRPLHAAAKFDTVDNPSLSKAAVANATGLLRPHSHHSHHHHPDGTVVNAMHAIPGLSIETDSSLFSASSHDETSDAVPPSTEALMTQVLLGTSGIEVDAINVMGRTPLHVACFRGNWPVVRLLLQAGASTTIVDRRGFTPGQLAFKRGMPIPNDLLRPLGDPPESGTMPSPRDLIVDPDSSTLMLSHELCLLHRTCPPIHRNSPEPPPENVRRLHVLIDEESGILRTGEFRSLVWSKEVRRAAMADILKVHDYTYVEAISKLSSSIPDHPNAVAHLDPDTAISRWSFESALRAAGSVCEAVDKVVAGESRNAFCAVRPPGHHAGPRGIVKCDNDPEGGSHGFCLLNNVAIGAAYARSMYRNEGIQKVAIVDFDVHHGNGTEEIIRQLIPTTERSTFRTPFAVGEISTSTYRPWLDESDIHNVFFSSTHGYGNRGYDQPGWFYPASGKSNISDALAHPAMVENPSLSDFLLSQTWARMGEESRTNCCKIINIGMSLPDDDSDPQARNMKQRLEVRDAYRKKIFPHLRDFDPDLIFISAGFDGHRRDTMNFGYVGLVEEDYEWITEQLVKIANTCCNGRVISVLEGGYRIHGGIVSPFARSVAAHVRALVDGGRSRELYDPLDTEWESHFERHLFERRERKKDQEREQLRALELAHRRSLADEWPSVGDTPEDPDAPSRKRRRNQVDYKELFKQMQHEGFAG